MKTTKQTLRLLLTSGLLITLHPASAQTWTQTSALNTNWYFIASSADGSTIFAPGGNSVRESVYVSTNAGFSWAPTTTPMTNSQFNVAVSADGITVLASRAPLGGTGTFASNPNPLFLSTNSGSSWTPIIGAKTNLLWTVAMSADAKILISGTANGWVFISTNSGVGWSSNKLWTVNGISDIVCSANGSKIAGLCNYILWTSTNSGLTWINNNVPSNLNMPLEMALSADGTQLAVVGQNNSVGIYVCVSTNTGATWNAPSLVKSAGTDSLTWIGSSADGTKLMTVVLGLLLMSTNSGTTWAQTVAPNTNWNSVISSADGTKWFATAYGKVSTTNATGGIWTLQTTPSPQLNLTTSPTNLTLAWTVPSTNFVLQQSADLATWSPVTNPPVLNLTNLQNQVTLSPSNTSGFYRLKTP